jgi:hypothetical protein
MSFPLVGTTVISSLLLWLAFGIQEAKPVLLLSLLFGAVRALISFARHRQDWATYVWHLSCVGLTIARASAFLHLGAFKGSWRSAKQNEARVLRMDSHGSHVLFPRQHDRVTSLSSASPDPDRIDVYPATTSVLTVWGTTIRECPVTHAC